MVKNEENNIKNFRPAAVPLITVDPYFSIWSCCDNLYDDYTRHWSGRTNPMFAGVIVDGKYYGAMGVAFSDKNTKMRQSLHITQESVSVTPMRSEYVFKNESIRLTLTFMTPLVLDRLDILSRPVSYIEYNIEALDGEEHETCFVFGIAGECAVDTWEQSVKFGRSGGSVFVGNAKQNVLGKTGDLVCIDWGYMHVADSGAIVAGDICVNRKEELLYTELCEDKTYNAMGENPYILLIKNEKSAVITLGYDEVKPIEYFGEALDEYYTKYFAGFDKMLSAAKNEYEEIKKLCIEYEKKIISDTSKFGEKYTQIASLAYRQAIAAHKLCEDREGNLLFLSKECYSNGCIGTLDITYPSIPLFLKYNPELVFGMLRPIIKYAESDKWMFDFAPHDVGQYPKVTGQVYYNNDRKYQMPVEECGNMLLSVAAAERQLGNTLFAQENREILKKWADYLLKKGYKPENQLCTDDFAGHLEENCNLSVKGILGIAAYGSLFGEESYTKAAAEMAKEWTKEAVCDYGSKLSFDREGTWSLKYNMVWDKLLGFNLFDEEIRKKEAKLYLSKMNRYGTPLDNRDTYTKMDWLFWTARLCEDKEYFDAMVDAVYKMICETEDRVPLCDWYDSVTGKQCEFQNRTVVGGIFINLL